MREREELAATIHFLMLFISRIKLQLCVFLLKICIIILLICALYWCLASTLCWDWFVIFVDCCYVSLDSFIFQPFVSNICMKEDKFPSECLFSCIPYLLCIVSLLLFSSKYFLIYLEVLTGLKLFHHLGTTYHSISNHLMIF